MTWAPAVTDPTSVHQSILESNLRPSVQQLKLSPLGKQDNDPKHSRKTTTEWPGKNSDLNLTELKELCMNASPQTSMN